MNPEMIVEFQRALITFADAHFACGEWTPDSEESYETVWARTVATEAEVWRIAGLIVSNVNITEVSS